MTDQIARLQSDVEQLLRNVADLKAELRSLRNDGCRTEDLMRARMDALFARLEVRIDPALAGVPLKDRFPSNPYL
jgi:cell division protein FtsB